MLMLEKKRWCTRKWEVHQKCTQAGQKRERTNKQTNKPRGGGWYAWAGCHPLWGRGNSHTSAKRVQDERFNRLIKTGDGGNNNRGCGGCNMCDEVVAVDGALCAGVAAGARGVHCIAYRARLRLASRADTMPSGAKKAGKQAVSGCCGGKYTGAVDSSQLGGVAVVAGVAGGKGHSQESQGDMIC